MPLHRVCGPPQPRTQIPLDSYILYVFIITNSSQFIILDYITKNPADAGFFVRIFVLINPTNIPRWIPRGRFCLWIGIPNHRRPVPAARWKTHPGWRDECCQNNRKFMKMGTLYEILASIYGRSLNNKRPLLVVCYFFRRTRIRTGSRLFLVVVCHNCGAFVTVWSCYARPHLLIVTPTRNNPKSREHTTFFVYHPQSVELCA